MSRDKSIGALSIKIRASVQSLATGQDIRVPLCRTNVLHLPRALAPRSLSILHAVLTSRIPACECNNMKQTQVEILSLY